MTVAGHAAGFCLPVCNSYFQLVQLDIACAVLWSHSPNENVVLNVWVGYAKVIWGLVADCSTVADLLHKRHCHRNVCVCVCVYVTGLVNVLLTTPLWVANTRLKLQGTKLKTASNSHGVCSSHIYRTKYTGLVGTPLFILQANSHICIFNCHSFYFMQLPPADPMQERWFGVVFL